MNRRGLVRWAIFSTHRSRCLFSLRGMAGLRALFGWVTFLLFWYGGRLEGKTPRFRYTGSSARSGGGSGEIRKGAALCFGGRKAAIFKDRAECLTYAKRSAKASPLQKDRPALSAEREQRPLKGERFIKEPNARKTEYCGVCRLRQHRDRREVHAAPGVRRGSSRSMR